LQRLKGKARKLSLGDVNPAWLFWIDAAVGPKGEIAFTGSTASQPSELYYMPSSADPPKRPTNFNQQIAALQLGKVDRFEWQGPDGFREDGILVYPPNFSKDKKYPLVLVIHGGPTDASETTFSGFAHLVAAPSQRSKFSRLQPFHYVQASSFARHLGRSPPPLFPAGQSVTFNSEQNMRRYLRMHRRY
jgi:hypothetical protein